MSQKHSNNLDEKKGVDNYFPALRKTGSFFIWYQNIETVTIVVTQYLSFQLQ